MNATQGVILSMMSALILWLVWRGPFAISSGDKPYPTVGKTNPPDAANPLGSGTGASGKTYPFDAQGNPVTGFTPTIQR